MNKKNLTPEYWEKIMDKPVEISFAGGESCEGIVKKVDEKSITIRDVVSQKMLVFGIEKIQKIQPLEA